MLYAGLAAIVLSVYLVVLLICRMINTRRHIGRQRLEDYQSEIRQENPEGGHPLEGNPGISLRVKSERASSLLPRSISPWRKSWPRGDIYLYPGEFILIVLFWESL